MKARILILVLLMLVLTACSSHLSFEKIEKEDRVIKSEKTFMLMTTDASLEKIKETCLQRGFHLEKETQDGFLMKRDDLSLTLVPNNMTDDQAYSLMIEK